MKNDNIAATVLLVVAVSLSAHIAHAAEPTNPKPEMSLSSKTPPSGGALDVIADFKLDKTVHLYKDKVRFEWRTLVGAKFTAVVLPKPEKIPDPLADEDGELIEVYTGHVTMLGRLTVTAKPGEPVIVEGKILHQSCTDQICFRPSAEPFAFALLATEREASPGDVQQSDPTSEAVDDAEEDDRGLWAILTVSFLAGVALALTPCVYPMIPVTAAVIGARKQNGIMSALTASFVYVLGLALTYAVIGLLVAQASKEASDEASIRSLMQSGYVLIPVSGIFVALAIVMFAGLNFAVPTGFAAKLQSLLAGRWGLASTFLLGAVSGLIAGPCVAAPLAGILIYVANQASPLLGFWMLFVLAWGMGVPLILFGMATGLMPKAGAWMEWIKRLLGFVLLCSAAYFLRNIIGSLAYQIALGAVLLAAAVFLGGFDTLTKESGFGDRLKRLFGLAILVGALFLVIPPLAQIAGLSFSGSPTAPAENVFTPATRADVDAAIAAGKPVVLDFSAIWCPNCKVLDRKVFTKPETVAAAEGLTMLKIDFDHEPGLARKYDVFGPPVLVFIGKDGKVRKNLSFAGMKTLDEFLELLRKFKQE